MKYLFSLLGSIVGVIALLASPSVGQTRIYFIGNSVTDCIYYSGLQALAESRGHALPWGRHMIPGAPLDYIWSHTTGGVSESAYGYYPQALGSFTWDIISLQPFDRPLENSGEFFGDRTMVKSYTDLAKSKSPSAKIFIYQRWPRKTGNDASSAAGFNTVWTTPYSGGWGGLEARNYFETVTLAARADGIPATMVPVGEVMNTLNSRAASGQFGSYSSIWNIYKDEIHLVDMGAYIVACTFYACIFGEDPHGLPVPGIYGTISPTLVTAIHDAVWSVVQSYKDPSGNPWSKVGNTSPVAVTAISVSPATLNLVLNQSATLSATVLPSNATNKAIAWTSGQPVIATVNSLGVVNAVAAGTATIAAVTQDGSFSATCIVHVAAGVAVSGVVLSPQTLAINVGETSQLTATVSPQNATDKNLSYASSDTTVAKVDATGKVTARLKGSATISVTTRNGGFTAACAITVAVVNTAPVAVIAATPISGMAPLTVNFSGTESHDADVGDYVLGFDWMFGDGLTANSNAPAHTFTSAGTYVVKLVVMDSRQVRGDTARVTIKVAADPRAPILISQKKPVVASSEENSTFAGNLPATNVTDGNLLTRWASNATDNEWISIDLGSVQSFQRVILRWEAAFGSSYKIQVSDNATTWTDVVIIINGNGGIDTMAANGSGRYVRMLGVTRGTQYAYSLYEFEVYQMPASTRNHVVLARTSQLIGEVPLVEYFAVSGRRIQTTQTNILQRNGKFQFSTSGVYLVRARRNQHTTTVPMIVR